MPPFTAVVGAATAAFSAALVAAPQVLIAPLRLEDSPDTRALTRALGIRDTVIGLAMVIAPAGRPRRMVTAARVLSDWGDAAAFGTGLAGRPRQAWGAAGGVTWGALALLAGVLDERAGR
jgi:hypothetical protein